MFLNKVSYFKWTKFKEIKSQDPNYDFLYPAEHTLIDFEPSVYVREKLIPYVSNPHYISKEDNINKKPSNLKQKFTISAFEDMI